MRSEKRPLYFSVMSTVVQKKSISLTNIRSHHFKNLNIIDKTYIIYHLFQKLSLFLKSRSDNRETEELHVAPDLWTKQNSTDWHKLEGKKTFLHVELQ